MGDPRLDMLTAPPIQIASPMRRGVSKGYQSGASLDLDKGTASIVVKPAEIPEDEAAWRKHIFEQTGMPVPDEREVILTGVRTWTMGGVENKHLTFKVVERLGVATEADITALVKLSRSNAGRKPLKAAARALAQTRIIGLSDEQIGKVDRHGGTPEFAQRLGVMLDELDHELRREPAEDCVILLGGDIIEGFQSHAGEQFMCDLSHPEQIDYARQYLADTITRIAARFEGAVRVVAVPSNHTAWRQGKGYLGKPSDDYGLMIVKAVASALAMNNRWAHVEFIFPEPWDVACAIPVRDDVVALVHGHVGNTSAASFDKWLDGQVSSDSIIAASTVVVNGHWHHALNVPWGNIGDRERRRIQLPALDGGSSQYTNARGNWSPPGLWTAVIRDGFGLDHERVLRAD